MLSVGNNFFFTKSLPCTLWFYDKAKPKAIEDQVLFLDMRNYFHVIDTTHNDWTPWQIKNIAAIRWLWRGETEKYAKLLVEYKEALAEADQVAKEAGDAAELRRQAAAVEAAKAKGWRPEKKTLLLAAAKAEALAKARDEIAAEREWLVSKFGPTGEYYKDVPGLCKVAKMMRGRAVTRSSIAPGDIPVMLGGREPAYYCSESNHTGPCFIVSCSGASAGYVSYWNEPIFVTDGFLFEGDTKSDTQFLYYSLKARQQSLIMSQNGTGIPHVRGEDLKNIELAFPTKEERKHIAAVLSDYDAAIANCRKQIALLEEADAYRIFKSFALSNAEQENFLVVPIDALQHPLCEPIVLFRGTVDAAPVYAREVFREAVRWSAKSVVVAHNHPSGDPSPSEDDIAMTKELVVAGELLGVKLQDHLIIGSPTSNGGTGYVSLRESNLIK